MRPSKDYIIFALDVPTAAEAHRFIGLLAGEVGMFKIGLELFIECGPQIVRTVRMTGRAGVFLDLKLHDIPATVSRAMGRVAELGADFVTVHCAGGAAMLDAAVAASRGRLGVLGVTVLTSLSPADLTAIGIGEDWAGDPEGLVIRRAAMAHAAGCAGIVCSGREAVMVKNRFGTRLKTVTPGIRTSAPGTAADDQKRTTTPDRAVRNGADYLVIGRPIRDAADPVAAVRQIAAEIGGALAAAPRL